MPVGSDLFAVAGSPQKEADTRDRFSDDCAIRELIAPHFAFVWRSLRRLGIPPADVDDAAQRVFLIAARRLSEQDIDNPRGFLFAVAMRVASDERRRPVRKRETLDADFDGQSASLPGPDELLDQHRARALLDDLIARMPLDLRAVFVLYEMEEMTVTEIAETLEIPRGSAASRLRRAREDFEQRLHRYETQCSRRGSRP